MKDEVGEKIKKIVFFEKARVHAQLKIRLYYDDLTQTNFFGALVKGFLERDERLLSYIDEYKKENNIQSKTKRGKIAQMDRKAKDIKKKFALDEKEIESIFDIVAQEYDL